MPWPNSAFSSSTWIPQGNLTSGLGLKGQSGATVYDALTSDEPYAELPVLETKVKNLSLVPADRQLTGAEVELVSLPNRERRLQSMLAKVRDVLRCHLHRHSAVARAC